MSGHRRLTLTLVYTPSRRYGLYVQGAGIHHNPILGLADSPHMKGRICVVLGPPAIRAVLGKSPCRRGPG